MSAWQLTGRREGYLFRPTVCPLRLESAFKADEAGRITLAVSTRCFGPNCAPRKGGGELADPFRFGRLLLPHDGEFFKRQENRVQNNEGREAEPAVRGRPGEDELQDLEVGQEICCERRENGR